MIFTSTATRRWAQPFSTRASRCLSSKSSTSNGCYRRNAAGLRRPPGDWVFHEARFIRRSRNTRSQCPKSRLQSGYWTISGSSLDQISPKVGITRPFHIYNIHRHLAHVLQGSGHVPMCRYPSRPDREARLAGKVELALAPHRSSIQAFNISLNPVLRTGYSRNCLPQGDVKCPGFRTSKTHCLPLWSLGLLLYPTELRRLIRSQYALGPDAVRQT